MSPASRRLLSNQTRCSVPCASKARRAVSALPVLDRFAPSGVGPLAVAALTAVAKLPGVLLLPGVALLAGVTSVAGLFCATSGVSAGVGVLPCTDVPSRGGGVSPGLPSPLHAIAAKTSATK